LDIKQGSEKDAQESFSALGQASPTPVADQPPSDHSAKVMNMIDHSYEVLIQHFRIYVVYHPSLTSLNYHFTNTSTQCQSLTIMVVCDSISSRSTLRHSSWISCWDQRRMLRNPSKLCVNRCQQHCQTWTYHHSRNLICPSVPHCANFAADACGVASRYRDHLSLCDRRKRKLPLHQSWLCHARHRDLQLQVSPLVSSLLYPIALTCTTFNLTYLHTLCHIYHKLLLFVSQLIYHKLPLSSRNRYIYFECCV
jgi:hypothetical protein